MPQSFVYFSTSIPGFDLAALCAAAFARAMNCDEYSSLVRTSQNDTSQPRARSSSIRP